MILLDDGSTREDIRMPAEGTDAYKVIKDALASEAVVDNKGASGQSKTITVTVLEAMGTEQIMTATYN